MERKRQANLLDLGGDFDHIGEIVGDDGGNPVDRLLVGVDRRRRIAKRIQLEEEHQVFPGSEEDLMHGQREHYNDRALKKRENGSEDSLRMRSGC